MIKITTHHEIVEFIETVPQGKRVVRVQLDTHSPRITCWVELYTRDRTEILPLSLFVSDIEGYVTEAKRRLNK